MKISTISKLPLLMFRLCLRGYLNAGLLFYFHRILTTGRENVPAGVPVIFAVNHQNAILDGVLVSTATLRTCHFLSRADIFRSPFAVKLLSLINSMPVYRIRDGFRSLGQNENTFKRCFEILARNECIIVFPEGKHSLQRRVRKLTKGFARIAFGAMQKHPEMNISIVPVGLNYSNHQKFGSDVHLIFGQPIQVVHYFHDPLPTQATRLAHDVRFAMTQLTTHIEDEANYEAIAKKLEQAGPDYLNPISTNQLLRDLARGIHHTAKPKLSALQALPLKPVALLPNIIPLLIWRLISVRIKDPAFIASAKFCTGISAFPLLYIVQSAAVGILFNEVVGLLWCLWSIPSMKVLRSM